jgi:hypothetical protein
MKKLTSEELQKRINLLQQLFNQGYTKQEILDKFKEVKERWFELIKKYSIIVHHHCNVCKTETNLVKCRNIYISDICKKCFMDKKLSNYPKEYITKNGSKLQRNFKKIFEKENRICRICGSNIDLLTVIINNKIVKKKICKKCYGKQCSNNMIKRYNTLSQEEKSFFGHKSANKRFENLKNTLPKEKFEEIIKQKEFKIFWDALSLEEKRAYTKNKISEIWKNKSQEKIDERSEKIFKAKLERGTFNRRPCGFDKKAQDLFWFLEKNIIYEKIYYATLFSKDINNIENYEFIVNVFNISKTVRSRRLDFYVKLKNNKEICIEFDPNRHLKKIQEDIIREKEILQVLSNIIILRISQEEYLKNKEYVQKELLNIILSIESTNNFNYDDINKKYWPCYKKYIELEGAS